MDSSHVNNPEELNMDADFWLQRWQDAGYQQMKTENVELMIQLLGQPPTRVLDIGAGPAFESRELHKKYNTEIWLLDGDFETTSSNPRATSFGSVESMKFYSRLEDLHLLMRQDNITDYHLVDANNIDIPRDVKFDLICSFLSCGFHYPVDTYRDLIQQHSHENTRYIFELRNNVSRHGVEIVSRLVRRKKSTLCEIRF